MFIDPVRTTSSFIMPGPACDCDSHLPPSSLLPGNPDSLDDYETGRHMDDSAMIGPKLTSLDSSSSIPPEVAEELECLAQILGGRVSIVVPPHSATFEDANPGGLIEVTGPDPKDVVAFVREFLVPELSVYPPDLMRDSVGLLRIVLVGNLTYNGQFRAALPDYLHFALYYSVEPRDSAFTRKTIHHEFFHLVDFAHLANDHLVDPEWVATNDPSTFIPPDLDDPDSPLEGTFYDRYGGEGMRDAQAGLWDLSPPPHPTTRTPGFVTGYARSAPIEDKSEVWAALMTLRASSLVSLTASDPALAAKCALLRSRVLALAPSMTHDWWISLWTSRESRHALALQQWSSYTPSSSSSSSSPCFINSTTGERSHTNPFL